MILIVSFLGTINTKLYSTKNFSNKNNYFHLDEIIKKFNFCKKIFFICKKEDLKKKIKFKNKKKVKLIFSSKTNNQILSIIFRYLSSINKHSKVKNYHFSIIFKLRSQ